MTDSCLLPQFDMQEAGRIARELFGLDGQIQSLAGERDLNFLVGNGTTAAVIKIANAGEAREMLECQHEVLERIRDRCPEFEVPEYRQSLNGNILEPVHDHDGILHYCRATTFVEGRLLAGLKPWPACLLEQLGGILGSLDQALEGYQHDALDRPLLWEMSKAPQTLDRLVCLHDPHGRSMIEMFRNRFERQIPSCAGQLRTGVIHNDANDHNILVQGDDPWQLRISGLIDFGDMVHSWLVAEPAIAAAYAMLGAENPLDAAEPVVRGYHAACPLNETEIGLLFDLMCMRLCLSVSICAYQRSLEPGNAYLEISEKAAWKTLSRLSRIPADFAHFCLRGACGLEPVPRNPRVVNWLYRHSDSCLPLFDPDISGKDLLVLDISVASPYLDPLLPSDVQEETALLFRQIRRGGYAAAVGLHDEYRLIYTSEDFRDFSGARRTLHLGLDVFMEPGTALHAPLDGSVFSTSCHPDPQDYGGTLILEHEARDEQGEFVFHTLYGHLDPASIAGLGKGDRIPAGSPVALIGNSAENGNWIPHVHFQIMTDLLDETDTFMGVGSHRHRNVWLSLCPDPNLILNLPCLKDIPERQETGSPPGRRTLLEDRARLLGPSLSLSYREPIEMVRAGNQYMYDSTGRRYLDAVNNVAHVGHCHPRVIEAIRRQSGVLNTNTRYLYEQATRYARALLDKFPEPLAVCYLVNSGSEANDLALRLATASTGRRARIVVDHAYHGNLTSLIDISPYKFNGSGGGGRPECTHVVPLPDTYRTAWSDQIHDECMVSVEQALHAAEDQGGVALFMAESISGCGGQVVLPDGYLQDIYARIRAAGGKCIADEVQVGFGRVGCCNWAFETQDVIPDIVTLGKPIGNGYPLGAVVTTREIADAFDNGMEYFNTYGGNPVACVAGIAVLDVIRDEGLISNAQDTGDLMRAELEVLASGYPLIGDVRGMGLFLGVECVLDAGSKTPASRQASYIVERMRQEGVLLSTDGPFRNVIKIKPPMCFDTDNVRELVTRMSRILDETFAQPDAGA